MQDQFTILPRFRRGCGVDGGGSFFRLPCTARCSRIAYFCSAGLVADEGRVHPDRVRSCCSPVVASRARMGIKGAAHPQVGPEHRVWQDDTQGGCHRLSHHCASGTPWPSPRSRSANRRRKRPPCPTVEAAEVDFAKDVEGGCPTIWPSDKCMPSRNLHSQSGCALRLTVIPLIAVPLFDHGGTNGIDAAIEVFLPTVQTCSVPGGSPRGHEGLPSRTLGYCPATMCTRRGLSQELISPRQRPLRMAHGQTVSICADHLN